MRSYRRLLAASVLAFLCAPGTFARTDVPIGVPRDIALVAVQGASATHNPAWRVEGVWEYSTGPTRKFGGFSALLALGPDKLRAFSDRGFRFTFMEPGSADEDASDRTISTVIVARPELQWMLWDIESATRDPATGDYWLGFENTHAIHRFSLASEPEEVRLLGDEVQWYVNGGLEAMQRLDDGRFLAIPEGRSEALIYPDDPVEGGNPQTIAFESPDPDFAVTDIAQLPDGRIMLLMRKLQWGLPPFAGLIAIAELPELGSDEPLSPQVGLRLDGIIPDENYEGLALRPQPDGSVAVWIISDDNISSLQRTLLAKLIFDPD
jgi:hypothetical protein